MTPIGPRHLSNAAGATVVYAVGFITGGIVMSFEMLGSRYLNPYFGSGIYTWAALIATVLTALTAGYFLGGFIADRIPTAGGLALTVFIGSSWLLALPSFAETVLELVLARVDDIRAGSALSAFAIMFFPVTCLGMYSPYAVRLLLRSPLHSGRIAGAVYGISTAGSIVGTLGTTFVLIPEFGTHAITLTLGALGVLGALILSMLHLRRRKIPGPGTIGVVLIGAVGLLASACRAEPLIDESVRAAILKRPDGRVAHLETEYNDIFITKKRSVLAMSFQIKGRDYYESAINLRDPDDLPVPYTQVMTVAPAYAQEPKRILMLGAGGGSMTTYLGRFMTDAEIVGVEIDPGVIDVAKKYFGVLETPRVRYIASDGRVFLTRNTDRYDVVLVDAFHGGYVPFHMLTKEFYTLLRQRLAPGGVAAFNVRDKTRLYRSTLKTLLTVFPGLDLYPASEDQVIAVASNSVPEKAALERRAATLQERYRFRFPLPELLSSRLERPPGYANNSEVITDDFAPTDVYGARP
jgi:predicted membrane-bound spermidine synthase